VACGARDPAAVVRALRDAVDRGGAA
jgi:hypothetical protein